MWFYTSTTKKSGPVRREALSFPAPPAAYPLPRVRYALQRSCAGWPLDPVQDEALYRHWLQSQHYLFAELVARFAPLLLHQCATFVLAREAALVELAVSDEEEALAVWVILERQGFSLPA